MNLWQKLFGGEDSVGPPERATLSDDLATQGPGTWVLFKQRILPHEIGVLLDLQRLAQLQTDDVPAALSTIAQKLMPFVLDWNWRDDRGQPLPKPGQGDISLDFRELTWLMDHIGRQFEEVRAQAVPLGTTSASSPRSGAEAGRPPGGTTS